MKTPLADRSFFNRFYTLKTHPLTTCKSFGDIITWLIYTKEEYVR